MPISPETCGAVILAGGLSRRMGKCKAMLSVDGQTMLSRTRMQLVDFDSVVLSCNDPTLSEGFDAVHDIFQDSGPLAGIHAALTFTDLEALFTVPCDLPNFSKELPRLLMDRMKPETDVLICQDSTGNLHPLCGIYRRRVLPVLEACLQQKEFRVMNFIHQVSWEILPTDGLIADSVFFNMNTPTDYEAALSHSEHSANRA